ncbi:hypothetical protein T265_10721, partial [Opisthorchis viverrini]
CFSRYDIRNIAIHIDFGKVSKSLGTQSGVRQGCSLSPFLLNFVIDKIVKQTLKVHKNPGVQVAC